MRQHSAQWTHVSQSLVFSEPRFPEPKEGPYGAICFDNKTNCINTFSIEAVPVHLPRQASPRAGFCFFNGILEIDEVPIVSHLGPPLGPHS